MSTLAETAPDFVAIAHRIVWCTVASVDGSGAPRTRILHPIWEWDGERLTGWIATSPESPKAAHLRREPRVSLTYWDPQHEQVIVDCKAEWQDDLPTRQWLWELLKTTPEPVGYDPKLFWPSHEDASFGALRLTPWRVEIWSLAAMAQGQPADVWRPHGA